MELLFEIGVEELPASFIQPALEALEARVRAAVEGWQISAEIATHGTPRRLVLVAHGLPSETPRRTVTVTGPPASAGFKDGQPTRAAEGFARSRGVDPSQLRIVDTPKGPYLGVDVAEGGEEVRGMLGRLLPEVALGLPFRKGMRWGSRTERFGRPIRWVVALVDGEVLPVTLAGIESGRITRGLRYFGPGEMTVASVDDYFRQLGAASIVVDVQARRERIRAGLHAAAEGLGGIAQVDEGLLEEVANLVEAPGILSGSFNPDYLALPPTVPVTVMKHHQRYFPVMTADGRLLPVFLQVTNNPGAEDTRVRQGNERVLSARLSDGHFFWREDLKIPLQDRLPRLGGIIFHARLGSIADKVERMRRLGGWLAAAVGRAELGSTVDRAAQLAKADLVTWMVGEFPELQGQMGREYARRAGEHEAVALAIEEHYLPTEAGGALPSSDAGALVALADKLDSIVAFHAIDKGPTGATDPYALRRAGLGVLRILIDRGWDVSLSAAVEQAFEGVAGRVQRDRGSVRDEVLAFFRTRLKGLLTQDGASTELCEAVLEAGSDRVADASLRARAITEMARSEDFARLMVAFKRAVNISRAEPDGGEAAMARLDGVGAALRDAVAQAQGEIARAVDRRDYLAALRGLLDLKAPVDAFFDNVLVMDPDLQVREARLAVLHRIAALFRGIADFGRL